MKKLVAAAVAATGILAFAGTASACPAGYHTKWIQGHPICTINTPKLKLKANVNPGLKKPREIVVVGSKPTPR